MIVRTVETLVHGRYLLEERGAERLLVGFHGYAETAEIHLAELQRIPGIDDWSLAAVQALHPFYKASGAVVASWMTSLGRELAIEDNVRYVRSVVAAIPHRTLVFLGFSQGASMAARAAAHIPSAGVVLFGGDVPPEVKAAGTAFPPTLVVRGIRDDWYTEEKFKDDLRFLGARGRTCEFDGGHEWAAEARAAIGEFLRSLP